MGTSSRELASPREQASPRASEAPTLPRGYLARSYTTPALPPAARSLAGTCEAFREFCVEGIEANEPRIAKLLHESLMLVTSLAPVIGYDKASAVAKHAHKHGKTLLESSLELGHVDEATFREVVRPENMV